MACRPIHSLLRVPGASTRPWCRRARSASEPTRTRSSLQETPFPAADPRAAIIVCLDFGDGAYEESVEEVVRLVQSAGVRRHRVVRGRRSRPDPRLYAGTGKVAEIGRAAAELNAGYVVFNHALSPAQERNVERELRRRVMDRTQLILEIFAQRAQTSEGKLQVELAQLEHLSTRLVRGWSHLERQKGGIGLRGEIRKSRGRRGISRQRVSDLRTVLLLERTAGVLGQFLILSGCEVYEHLEQVRFRQRKYTAGRGHLCGTRRGTPDQGSNDRVFGFDLGRHKSGVGAPE